MKQKATTTMKTTYKIGKPIARLTKIKTQLQTEDMTTDSVVIKR